MQKSHVTCMSFFDFFAGDRGKSDFLGVLRKICRANISLGIQTNKPLDFASLRDLTLKHVVEQKNPNFSFDHTIGSQMAASGLRDDNFVPRPLTSQTQFMKL